MPSTARRPTEVQQGGTSGDAAEAMDGDRGTTRKVTVASGTYALSETAGNGASFTGYSSTLSCVLRGTTTKVSVTNGAVVIAKDADVVCTFTNTRQAPKTGAKTIGFWQNKNGQGTIKADASTSGVCNSEPWLRGYAPFQDLSATATCTQVASYVYNVVKAASARGASMNVMLKAQMLATALDTYFSDPALGGKGSGLRPPSAVSRSTSR